MGRRQRKRSDEGFSFPFDREAQAVLRPLHNEHIAREQHEILNLSDPNMQCKLYMYINLLYYIIYYNYFVEKLSSKNLTGPSVSKQEQEEGSREDFMV